MNSYGTCNPMSEAFLQRIHPWAALAILRSKEGGLRYETRSIFLRFENPTVVSLTGILNNETKNDFFAYDLTFNLTRSDALFAGSVFQSLSDDRWRMNSGFRVALSLSQAATVSDLYSVTNDSDLPIESLCSAPGKDVPLDRGKWNWPMHYRDVVKAVVTQTKPLPEEAYGITVELVFRGLRFQSRCWDNLSLEDTILRLRNEHGLVSLCGRIGQK